MCGLFIQAPTTLRSAWQATLPEAIRPRQKKSLSCGLFGSSKQLTSNLPWNLTHLCLVQKLEYIKLCRHSHGIIIIQVPHINSKNLRLMLQFFCHENQSTGRSQGRYTAPILDLEVLREPAAWESQGWAHWNPGCSYWCKITGSLSLFNVRTLDFKKKMGPEIMIQRLKHYRHK